LSKEVNMKSRIPVKMAKLLVPLLLYLTPTACTNSKQDQCVAIRKAIKAEMIATKEVAAKLRDPQALTAQAGFLKTTITELQKVQIEDAALKQAVQTYINAVTKLAEGYHEAAEGLKLLAKGEYQAAGDKMPGPGSGLVIYGTIVDSTRIRIADECNKP
jgi:hypothetical protein